MNGPRIERRWSGTSVQATSFRPSLKYPHKKKSRIKTSHMTPKVSDKRHLCAAESMENVSRGLFSQTKNNWMKITGHSALKGTLSDFRKRTRAPKLHNHGRRDLNRKLLCVRSK